MRMSAEYAFGMARPPDESMPPDSPIYRPWESCDSIRQEHALVSVCLCYGGGQPGRGGFSETVLRRREEWIGALRKGDDLFNAKLLEELRIEDRVVITDEWDRYHASASLANSERQKLV